MPDYTEGDLNKTPDKADIKVVPGASAPPDARRAWLTLAFAANGVGEVVRWGGESVTAMTVEIFNQLEERRVVRFEHEDDATRHGTLRAELIRQAGVRAEHITNAKIAGDVYFLLCSLARIEGPLDPLSEVREWMAGYRLDAAREPFSLAKPDLYRTLDRIRNYPYDRKLLALWQRDLERRGEMARDARPKPPLFVERTNEGEWTSISHFACYVRWDLDIGVPISSKTLAGRVVEVGGDRRRTVAWDATTRTRQHRIEAVLIRFPDEREEP
jgi:hypothetical protein